MFCCPGKSFFFSLPKNPQFFVFKIIIKVKKKVKQVFKKIKKCRICSSTRFKLCLDLGEMYYTGIFPKSKNIKIKKAPLQLVRCDKKNNVNNCGLVQLRHTYDHNYMYGDNYGYRYGLNLSTVIHLNNKVNGLPKIISISKNIQF